MRKLLVVLTIIAGCGAGFAARAAEMVAPDVLARTVTEEVLQIVRSDKDIQAGDRGKVHDLIETKIAPHFNFSSMTRLAMGKNWRRATPEQRSALISEFRTLLVRTYTAAFTQYRNQTIEFRPLRLAPTDDDVVVKSLIKQPGGQPVAVDYSMEKTGQGWKVYNVKIEGISLVENYRNTFNAEVERDGVPGLIKALSEKNRTLAQVIQK